MPTYQFESDKFICCCADCPCLDEEFSCCNLTGKDVHDNLANGFPAWCPLKGVEAPDGALFDRFYEAYPKHVAVGDAKKAFKALKVTEDVLAKMLSAIAVQKANGTIKKGDQFTPQPARWLRARRWEDEADIEEVGGIKWI